MNRGSAGARAVNATLPEALNPAQPGQPSVERFGFTLPVGDKAMQTENNYDRDVFNGDRFPRPNRHRGSRAHD